MTNDDQVIIAFRNFMERELGLQRERYSTRAERFRAAAAETHADWRLNCMPPRWTDSAVMIFREGIADIIKLRLRIAYMPLFQGLERIERRCGILADLRREPWASPSHPMNAMIPSQERHTP